MILDSVGWMDLRRYRALHEAGASISAIARETGRDWRTVKKYLTRDGGEEAAPPQGSPRRGTQPRKIDAVAEVVDAWLRADVRLRASVIHERLVAEYGFDGSYQRVKMYVSEARPRIRGELGLGKRDLAGLHRRFEVTPGAQAQVDWGDEGDILEHVGIEKVYSFHMTLSYSRDPFCCFVTSMDMATFWDCHRRAFDHFGGVPAALVYDRVKTVVRRHVAPGVAVPLHPEAVAFAGHYGFAVDVLAAYRPTGKGRVERQVDIVRQHVLAARVFGSLTEVQAAFAAWVPMRRAQVHRTHGQVIAARAVADHAGLRPLPPQPYLVAERHLRRVGKDCLISFEGSVYSLPARRIRAGQRVEVRATPAAIAIHDPVDGALLATHARAAERGGWVVDEAHWDGLPTGHTRAVVAGDPPAEGSTHPPAPPEPDPNPLRALLTQAGTIEVTRRPLADYDALAGLGGVRF